MIVSKIYIYIYINKTKRRFFLKASVNCTRTREIFGEDINGDEVIVFFFFFLFSFFFVENIGNSLIALPISR